MTDWQNQYALGQTPWDRGSPAPSLVQILTTFPATGRILVPGCGTGQDVKAWANAGAERVIGLDVAPLAVARAAEVLVDFNNSAVQLGDLFIDCAQPPLANSFDLVWEHTCYCAIPPARRADYVAAVAAALKPEGQLLGVFFLNPWDASEDQTQGPPFGTRLEALIAMFEPHFDLVRGWRPEVAYQGREGREWCGLFVKKTEPIGSTSF